jgi:phosphate transport system permease protein
MTVDLQSQPAASTAPKLGGDRPPGLVVDTVFRWLAWASAALVLAILALIAYSTVREAWPAFTSEGIDFIIKDDWVPNANQFGALALIYGTVLVAVISLCLGVPLSIGIALFITEVAPRRVKRPIIYVIDLLAAVPSVVYGLWGILVLVPALDPLYQDVASAVDGIPILDTIFNGDPISGRSFMTAGLILAIMVTPIITSVARETFATVPQSQKDGAYAMGATRWEMIRAAVFPHSRSGVTAGVLLGFGRAIGETIAVALVVGSSVRITPELFSSGDTMASNIVNGYGESSGTYQAALIGLGVVLFVLTMAIGIIARTVISRSERKIGHASV